MAEWMNVPDFQWLKSSDTSRVGPEALQALSIGAHIATARANQELQAKELLNHTKALELRQQQYDQVQQQKELAAQGYIALNGVMGKWAGRYDDPQAEAEFRDTASKYPWTVRDPAFNHLAQIFQDARNEKAKANLITQQYQGRMDLEETRQQALMDRLNARLDSLTSMENLKQEHRNELESLKNDLRMLRDKNKPPAAQNRFDLLDSDRTAYQEELKSLRSAFEYGRLKDEKGKTISDFGAFQKMQQGIIDKYQARARSAPANAPRAQAPPESVEEPPPPAAINPAVPSKVLKFNPATGQFE